MNISLAKNVIKPIKSKARAIFVLRMFKSIYINIYQYRVLLLLFLVGCMEALPPDPSRLGYEYFPLTTGDYRIYNVERIDYNSGISDTTHYQLLEVISTPTEQNGIISYRLERFIRENETVEWMLDSVWSTRINNYQAIVVENNMPIIKLSFPIAEGREWDGNAMNVKDTTEFMMQNVGQDYVIDGVTYSSTLEVIMEDLIDPVQVTEDNYHAEVYAKNIGRIYKLFIYKNYKCPISCELGSIIDPGVVIEQTLVEFGNIE